VLACSSALAADTRTLPDVMYVPPWHIATRGINAELGVSHISS